MLRTRVAVLVAAASVAGPLAANGAAAAVGGARPSAIGQIMKPNVGHREAGRTLKVQVDGLAKRYRAQVLVTGPARFHRRVGSTTTLKHLRPGRYRVRENPTRVRHGARIFPAQRRQRVRVGRTRGAEVFVKYVTLVPKTTKALPAHAVRRIRPLHGQRRLIQFSRSAHPARGDVLAAGVGPNTPHGLLVKVVSVRRSGAAVVRPATLLDALPQGEIDATEYLDSSNETPSASRHGLAVADNGAVEKKVDGPLCTGDLGAKASGSISIRPSFNLSASWSLFHGVTAARLTSTLTEDASLKASIEAAGSCSGSRSLFNKPVTFATFVVDVGGIPIVLQPQLQITFEGEANVDAAVTTSADQTLAITAGLEYQRSSGISPVYAVNNTHSAAAPSLSGSADVRATVNPEIDLLIDGIGGPEVGLTGGLELSADIHANPWWTLNGFLTGNAGVTIPLLHFDKRVNLATKTWTLAHASGSTTSINVTPSLAYAWSDSVCGFHPDDLAADFEVQGTGFGSQKQVTVDTDWAPYGLVDADAQGAFDTTNTVGEVPSADYGDYYISANDGSHSASATIELDSSACANPTDSDGNVTLQWGASGDDPETGLSLVVDDNPTDSATTDDSGSGGSTVTFPCPASGSYTWDVYGTDNGHDESLQDGPLTQDCTPAGATPSASRLAPIHVAPVAAAGGVSD